MGAAIMEVLVVNPKDGDFWEIQLTEFYWQQS